MGYYLQIDTQDAQPLASLTGWGDVIRWVATLPPAESPALHHLTQFGWEDDLTGLQADVSRNAKARPPASHETQQTLANMAKMLAAHAGGATVVTVTDGLGTDGDEAARQQRAARIQEIQSQLTKS